MIYQIYCEHNGHRKVLFDIEYYLIKSEHPQTKDLWHSEIHVLPIVEGLWRFFESIKNDNNFDSETFIKDADNIQELRGWLWEVDGNKYTVDSKLHYGDRQKHIETTIFDFTKKYKLYVNID